MYFANLLIRTDNQPTEINTERLKVLNSTSKKMLLVSEYGNFELQVSEIDKVVVQQVNKGTAISVYSNLKKTAEDLVKAKRQELDI